MFKLHGPASILKYQTNIKLRQKQFHMKDTGKSSSRKLRRVIYYTLYRMDPQKTHYKIIFSATFPKIKKIENWGTNRIYSPPNSRSTAPLRRLFMLKPLFLIVATPFIIARLQPSARRAEDRARRRWPGWRL